VYNSTSESLHSSKVKIVGLLVRLFNSLCIGISYSTQFSEGATKMRILILITALNISILLMIVRGFENIRNSRINLQRLSSSFLNEASISRGSKIDTDQSISKLLKAIPINIYVDIDIRKFLSMRNADRKARVFFHQNSEVSLTSMRDLVEKKFSALIDKPYLIRYCLPGVMSAPRPLISEENLSEIADRVLNKLFSINLNQSIPKIKYCLSCRYPRRGHCSYMLKAIPAYFLLQIMTIW
jgi:hypothetical protein